MLENIQPIIDQFITQYCRTDELRAVGLQGGYARGSANENSDIDLVLIFTSETTAGQSFKGRIVYSGKMMEVRHIYLDKVNPGKWKDKVRYIYACETIILEERDDELRKLIQVASMTSEEAMKKIVYSIRKMGTHGIVYHDLINHEWRGFYWGDPYDYWVKKSDLFAAHLRLNECDNILIQLIYAINYKFMPSSKYRYHILGQLEWLPKIWEQRFIKMNCYDNLSEETYLERVKEYRSILEECIEKADSMGLMPTDFKVFYTANFSKYTDNTED